MIINYPTETIGAYDIVVYPKSFGGDSGAFAMIYHAGTTKAVWETAAHDTVMGAFIEARRWYKENTVVVSKPR